MVATAKPQLPSPSNFGWKLESNKWITIPEVRKCTVGQMLMQGQLQLLHSVMQMQLQEMNCPLFFVECQFLHKFLDPSLRHSNYV